MDGRTLLPGLLGHLEGDDLKMKRKQHVLLRMYKYRGKIRICGHEMVS